MLVQHLDVVADQFLGSERVQAAADGIHRARDLLGRAVLGALEHHVLDEVRKTGLVQFFFARTGADPDPDRDAAHVRHPLGDDADTVGRALRARSRGSCERRVWASNSILPRAACGAGMLFWKVCRKAIVGMELADLAAALGPDQPAFRARQIYRRGLPPSRYRSARCFNLAQALCADAACRWDCRKSSGCYDSTDGTRRYLLKLADGKTVETVWMPEGERSTICISSQVGCPVDCKFCLTALMGLERNLTRGRNRRPGAARRRRPRPAGERRPAEHRHDGPGRAAAESAQRDQGHAAADRSGRHGDFAAADYACRRRELFPRSPSWRASRCGRSWRFR